MDVQIKRIYDERAASDGCRVLVDRLWPRGIKKTQAGIDHWFKTLAPSAELRRWFAHDPKRWEGFRHRYLAELEAGGEELGLLRRLLREGRVTLLFAARDTECNNAVVLKAFLERQG